MKKTFLFSLINIFFVISCFETKSRGPIKFNKKNFLKNSANRNIDVQKKENLIFFNVIKKDSKSKYKTSNKGFWFKILKSSKKKLKPKSGDTVKFIYNILDIKGNDIYKDDNLKPIYYIIDKEEILPALRNGIKELRVGESGFFLMPSFLCYGYQGDGEKIIANQPLIVEIDLISLKTNTN